MLINLSPMSNWGSEIRSDVFCNRLSHVLQSLARSTLDPCQPDCPIHSPPILQICGWQGHGQDDICPNTTVQGSGELLYWLSLLLRSLQSGQEQLPDDIDSGNEANSESEEDMPATFTMEPTVAYLNDHDCNDFAENDDEWVINENIAFDYSLCPDDVFNFVKSSSLHMPLPTVRWHECG